MVTKERIKIVQDHFLISINEPQNNVVPEDVVKFMNLKFGYVVRNPLLESAVNDEFNDDSMKKLMIGDSVYFINSSGVIPVDIAHNDKDRRLYLVPMSYVIFGIDNQ
jgi:hypothetical protein